MHIELNWRGRNVKLETFDREAGEDWGLIEHGGTVRLHRDSWHRKMGECGKRVGIAFGATMMTITWEWFVAPPPEPELTHDQRQARNAARFAVTRARLSGCRHDRGVIE